MAGRARRAGGLPPFQATGRMRSACGDQATTADRQRQLEPGGWSGGPPVPRAMATVFAACLGVAWGFQGRSIRIHVRLPRCRLKPCRRCRRCDQREVSPALKAIHLLPWRRRASSGVVIKAPPKLPCCTQLGGATKRRMETRPRPSWRCNNSATQLPGWGQFCTGPRSWRRAVAMASDSAPGRTSAGARPTAVVVSPLACSRCWNPLPPLLLRSTA